VIAIVTPITATTIEPGSTLLDTFKQSFTDFPVDPQKDNAISTTEFLDAAESLTTMFGKRGPFLTLSYPHGDGGGDRAIVVLPLCVPLAF